MTAAVLAPEDALLYAFRRNVVVAASAGTGKTYRLTALYVLLTLGLTSMGQRDERRAREPIGPERIVATTFSRAAAQEISDRVQARLSEIAAWSDDGPSPELAAVLGARLTGLDDAPSLAEIKRRAADALARLSGTRIDTLHGLAQQIVKMHALALGVAAEARVVEEDEAQALAALAVDETLGAALEVGGARAEAARSLVAAAGGVPGARTQVSRLLDRLDEEGLTPSDLALAEHLAQAHALVGPLRSVAETCASGPGRAKESAEALMRAFASASPENMLPGAAEGPLRDFLATRMTAKKTPADEALMAFREDLPGDTNPKKAAQVIALLREAPRLNAREKAIVALLEDARARLSSLRRREGVLSFGDMLRVARDGLRDQPEIASAVRAGVDALLVDEFQDTSRAQRDIVYLLREREGCDRPKGQGPTAEGLLGHGLFLVGDRKQSIYGFRGADVAVFSRITGELCGPLAREALALPASICAPIARADLVALRESRRSGEKILSFVNAFSAHDFSAGRDGNARDFEVTYGPADHLMPVASAAGAGDVVLIEDDGASPPHAEPIVRNAKGSMREALLAAAWTARFVRSGEGAFKDVAILARRRRTLPLVELALARLDVPYVVSGRALYDTPEVRDVAAVLRLLVDRRDRLALATVLRGPAVGLSDAALAWLATPDAGLSLPIERPDAPKLLAALPAWEHLGASDRTRLEDFVRRFVELRRAILRLHPAEAIRAALAAFDLDRVFAAMPRPETRIGNVDRLLGVARRRGGTLGGFVRWLDRRMRDDADEREEAVFSDEEDAVRLLTIHASKGLDFPVVITVDLDAGVQPRSLGLSLASLDGERLTLVLPHHPPRPDPLADEALEALARGEKPTYDALGTAALVAGRELSVARERAERQRLTYVAITRPKRSLVLVGVPRPAEGKKRRATGSAFESLENALDKPEIRGALTRIERASALLDEALAPPGDAGLSTALTGPAPPRPARPPTRMLSIATTPLSLFQGCPRRFRLRQLLGFDEPLGTGYVELDPPETQAPGEDGKDGKEADTDPTYELDPRMRGLAAHAVLELWPREGFGMPTDGAEVKRRLTLAGLRPDLPESTRISEGITRFLEGPYTREIREQGLRMLREEPFVLTIELSPAPDGTPRALALRGAVDLVAFRPDGTVDVVDYKLSRPRKDLAVYAFQLCAYALSMHRREPDRPIRAGVVFLAGGPGDPIFLPAEGPNGTISPAEHERFARELAALGERFAEARWADRFDAVPLDGCRKLHCGFVGACYGPEHAAAV
ncbi:UvrD-helicase domain-containing protein [Polyangium aurulentum]|uniref:UvrD-helicase domain-containing protein n=1 Tax=Polyangium aurulentum TaxID=2567896 RepID=UPI0010AE6CA8|nr:UvrD-helicase domain-containing protein [Polyangium aurulentum]UQA59441.1 UvrD-helicase domain-containing protein [Polyangium aurulentum]